MLGSLLSIFLIALVQPLFVIAGGGGTLPTVISLLFSGLLLAIFAARYPKILQAEFFDKHLIITAVCCGIGTATMANAVLYTNVAIVQFISLLSPLFAAIIFYFGFFNEKITRWQVYAFLVGLIGIVILSTINSSDAPHNDPLVGFSLSLFGTLMITITALRLRTHANKTHPVATQSAFLTWAGISLIPLTLIIPTHVELNYLPTLLLIGALFALGNWVLLYGLKKITSSKMLMLRPIGAVVSTIASYFLLDQTVKSVFYYGAFFILISVIMLAKEPTIEVVEETTI